LEEPVKGRPRTCSGEKKRKRPRKGDRPGGGQRGKEQKEKKGWKGEGGRPLATGSPGRERGKT